MDSLSHSPFAATAIPPDSVPSGTLSTPSKLADTPLTPPSGDRNVRKRHSFFAKSSLEAPRGQRRLHRTGSNQGNQGLRDVDAEGRPVTAGTEMRRRRTDTLESIRNSFFGGRKKEVSVTLEQEQKMSISPPFNFKHVTHTAKKQFQSLETVDERDLTAKFRSVSAVQKPLRHLRGINAENVVERQRTMSLTWASSSAPVSPIELPTRAPSEMAGCGDEMMFDERRDTKFDPNAVIQDFQTTPSPQPHKYQRRQSFLSALRTEALNGELRSPSVTYKHSPSRESEIPSERTLRTEPIPSDIALTLVAMPEEEQELLAHRPLSGLVERVMQPLPPLPLPELLEEQPLPEPPLPELPLPELPLPELPLPESPQPELQELETISRRASKSSRLKTSASTASIESFNGKPASTKSKRSSRSTRISKSPAMSSIVNELRTMSVLSDATWEDDVEFCYEQEAEATCDFDWKTIANDSGVTSSPESLSAESDGGVRLSQTWVGLSPAPLGVESLKPTTSAVQRRSGEMQHHRGSSVGHRGFLAARGGSADVIYNKHVVATTPPALETTPSASLGPLTPPAFNVTTAAATEDNATKPLLFPSALQLANFENNPGYFSDPESCRSKHRKSSSYGSWETTARRSQAPNPAEEKERWSLVSSSSVPDLLQSNCKRRSSLLKPFISRLLETLPQSPSRDDEGEKHEADDRFEEMVEPPLFMRRPQTPGDRAVLQAAGRVVQKGRDSQGQGRERAASRQRFSRLLLPQEMHRLQKQAPERWI